MAQTSINIRMDEDLKRSFSLFCDEIGLSMTSTLCMLAKQCVKKQRIPFELEGDPFYGEKNMAFLRESLAQMNQGQVVIKTMAELEAMESA